MKAFVPLQSVQQYQQGFRASLPTVTFQSWASKAQHFIGVFLSTAELNLPPYVRRSRGHYTSYDDPNALCGVIFVRSKFMAKILFHFLKDLSRSEDTFSFLMPQYATTIGDSTSTVDDEGITDVEAERRKQEESLRKFRMKESNLLVSNSLIEVGIDSVR